LLGQEKVTVISVKSVGCSTTYSQPRQSTLDHVHMFGYEERL